MNKKISTVLKKTLCYTMMAVMVVCFVPLNTSEVSAASFDAKKQITGVAVTGTGYNTISIKWSAQTGATGYQVYTSTKEKSNYKYRKDTKNLKYTYKGTTNTTYYLKVRAYYKKDSKSAIVHGAFSTPVKASMVLGKPTIKIVPQAKSVKVTWSKVAGASGYQLQRAKSQSGSYKTLKTTKSLSYKHSTAKTYRKYWYKVRAYKVVNGKRKYGPFSTVMTGMTQRPVPKNIKAAGAGNGVQTTWSKVDYATGYTVFRSARKDKGFTAVGSTAGLKFVDQTATIGNTHYYKVLAYTTMNGIKYYGAAGSAVSIKYTLSAPVVTVTPQAKAIKLSWPKVTNAMGYEISRATSSGGSYTKVGTATTNTYTDQSAKSGQAYYYKVRAYATSNGTNHYGSYSAPVHGKFVDGAPIVEVTPTEMSVKLSWPAISGITGYEVYRATSSDGSYKKLGVNTKSPTWENDELTLGTLYYYKVRTYKKSGSSTTHGPFSVPVPGRTLVQAPTSIKGSVSSSGITLTWNKATNAVGYQVARSTSSNGTYTEIGTTTSTSYKDTKSLTSGKTYYYKVRSYMTLNGKTYYGGYSAISASRNAVVTVALAWLGCKESNGSHKKIIDVYNSNLAPGCGKMNYTAAWCATYVSAVGIKAKATDIIVRHSYCPTMLNTYKKQNRYSTNKSYAPKPGDIIFYDWNSNNTPDHVGMIVSCSGSTIKAIEGNKNNAVGYRTFSKGYKYIQAYGLPAYSETGNGYKYTGANSVSASAGGIQTAGNGLPIFNKKRTGLLYASAAEPPVVAEAALEEAGIDAEEPDGYSDIGEEYEEAEEDMAVGCAEETTELEKMKFIIRTVREEAETGELQDCTETEYYSAFLYKLCEEAGIDACICTEIDENGEKTALIEVTLDGQLYQVDPSTESFTPVEYTPEVTDCNVTE